MGNFDIRFAAPKAPRHQLLLYSQSLDELVPADGPVRLLAGLLEELDWSSWERSYRGVGQPAIHPRYIASAILFGLMNRVKSTRELELASRKHLDFIWLLEGFTPDHSTFANFRLRHAKAIEGLKRQIAESLVRTRETPLLELILDGTRLRADSDRHGTRTAKTIEAIITELDRRMEEMKRNDALTAPAAAPVEGLGSEQGATEQLERVEREIAKLEAQRAKYQRALDIARERDARARQHNGQKAKPVHVPVTDPESHVTPNKEGGHAPNYTPVAAVEPQSGAIVYDDVLDSSDEAEAVIPAVAQAQALTEHKVSAVLADSTFAEGHVLATLDTESIDAYMPTRSVSPPDNPALRQDPTQPISETQWDRLPKRGGQLARTAFVYDTKADVYYCPMGHTMRPYKRGKINTGTHCTYYTCRACAQCPLLTKCVKGKGTARSITRDQYEDLREATNARMASEAGKAIYRKRAPGIEGVFAHIKSAMGIRRFARRGLDKVRCDWSWITAAYNLKKLVVLRTRTTHPAPDQHPRVRSNAPDSPKLSIFKAILAVFLQYKLHCRNITRQQTKTQQKTLPAAA